MIKIMKFIRQFLRGVLYSFWEEVIFVRDSSRVWFVTCIAQRAGVISFYLLLLLALSLGVCGGFFLGREPILSIFPRTDKIFQKPVSAEVFEADSSLGNHSNSLLGTVSEVFERALGKASEHLVAEIILESSTLTSSSVQVSKPTSTSELFSLVSSSVSVGPEKKSEKISDCRDLVARLSNHEILVNELAWMGSVAQADESAVSASRREWMELLNISSRTISLVNWQIRDTNGKFKIIFPTGATLRAHSFYLLARGSSEKIFGKKPDITYSAALPNGGANLQLINNQCEIVDEVNAISGWSVGDRGTKRTMERNVNDLGWHTSVLPGGTPKMENSVIAVALPVFGGSVSLASTISSPSVASSSAKATSVSTSSEGAVYPKLLITEIKTASTKSVHDEFAELYNPNELAVDLAGWYLQKETKSASSFMTFLPKAVLAGKSIPAHSFFVISHPSSSFASDVESDEGLSDHNTVVLKNPEGVIVDKVGWGEAGDFEGQTAPNPEPGRSIQRKFVDGSFSDTDVNSLDFEVRDCPSPGSVSADCSPVDSTHSTSSGQAHSTSSFDTTQDRSGQASSPQAVATSSENLVSSSSSTEATSTLSNATTTEGLAFASSSSSNSSTTYDISDEVAVLVTSTDSTASSSADTSSDTASSTATSSASEPNSLNHLVIFEIQITGGAGKTDNDFIRIFNPTTTTVNLSGWKLRKRTQSGTESSIRVFPDGSEISPAGIFLWANSKDGFSETVGAQVSSTQTISNDTSVALFDVSGILVDAVAWGGEHVGPFVEGSPFLENPGAGQVLRRKLLDSIIQDTDNNAEDLELTPR
jgi:hypothetical protein